MVQDIFSLRKILTRRGGLFSVRPKLPIKSKHTLGMIYTPGVAHVCKTIANDINRQWDLTNKGNSMFIMTDSTAFSNFDRKTWNTDCAMPYLEAKTQYYKETVNIDAYPLNLDYTKINTAEELYEIIYQMSCSYVACDIYRIENERQFELERLLQEKPIEIVIVTHSHRKYIQLKLKEYQFDDEISFNLVVSSIMRGLIDLRKFGMMSYEQIDYCFAGLGPVPHSPYSHDVLRLQKYLQLVLTINTRTLEFYNNPEFNNSLLEDHLTYGIQKPEKEDNYIYHDHTNDENALYLHKKYKGVIQCVPRLRMLDPRHLDLVFHEDRLKRIEELIREDPKKAEYMTCRKNFCGIVTNGTAILGLGAIGGLAGMPVMEGKSVLFKEFGNADVMPICLYEKDPHKLALLVEKMSPTFGAINLEDIKGPDCFYVENYLKRNAVCPVFHDDQHGTAIVVLAGLINALRLKGTHKNKTKIVISGAGAAGLSITQLQLEYGFKDITVQDIRGVILTSALYNLTPNELKTVTKGGEKGLVSINCEDSERKQLPEALMGADIFVGVSAGGAQKKEWIKNMNEKPIVFALANPVPEIYPKEAIEGGAFAVATGRSDFPNQVNNSLAFPGIFRAILDVRATEVTTAMELASAQALADMIPEDKLTSTNLMPDPLDFDVPSYVAAAVARVAIEQGTVKEGIDVSDSDLKAYFKQYSFQGSRGNNRSILKKPEDSE